MKPILYLLLSGLALPAAAQHSNVLISNAGNPEEPTICISTKNPKYIVAGANLNRFFFSSDTGRTWTGGILTSPYGVWGDPAIICDTAGTFHYLHLSNPGGNAILDRIVAQRSTNNGQSWGGATFFGLNGTKDQDKEWVAFDRRNKNLYAAWTQFDAYGSTATTDSSHILFVRSTDGGLTWSTPIRLDKQGGDCIDEDNTVEGAVPAVGPNGEVYVAWAGPQGLLFDRSLDGGLTWMDTDKQVATIPNGWDFTIPGIDRCNGLPVTACDVSNGPRRGTIYINWTDQRNGNTDTDVWLAKSTDGGNSWSAPIRVNDDAPGHQQFLTWMAIDQRNGDLWFVFYDRRQYNDVRTDVYMARSRDGGQTFQNFRVSESPFAPVSSVFFGDYNNLSVEGGVVRPVWTRMDNGTLSIWTALIDTARLDVQTAVPNLRAPEEGAVRSYPNPFTNYSYLSFESEEPATVTVRIYDMGGRLRATPVQRQRYTAGPHTIHIDAAKYRLSPAEYLYEILINGKRYGRKMIRIE